MRPRVTQVRSRAGGVDRQARVPGGVEQPEMPPSERERVRDRDTYVHGNVHC